MHVLVIAMCAWLAITAVRVGRGFVAQQLERQDRLPWTAARWAVISRESVLHVAFRLLAPLGWGGDDRPEPATQRAVLLVQDPAVPRVAMSVLETFLRHRGFDVWLPPRPANAPLAEQAERLDSDLKRWLENSEAEEVDLVAFGAGGLTAGWLVARLDHSRVRRLITLGTPWRGTRMAVFAGRLASQEQRPGASALDGLLPARVELLSVWCPDDPVVVPASSAVAWEPLSVAIEGAGHLGLLVSARALRAVLAGLRGTTTDDA